MKTPNFFNRSRGKHAWIAKVGTKGQIVIPKEARELFNIQTGDTLLLLGDEKRGLAIARNEDFAKLYSAIFIQEEGQENDSDSDS